MNKRLAMAASCALIGSMLLFPSAVAASGTASGGCTPHIATSGVLGKRAAGAKLIESMRQAGASDAAIDAAMASDLCMTRVPDSKTASSVAPMTSSSSAVRVYAPVWYWDTNNGTRQPWYDVYVSYSWLNTSFTSEVGIGADGGPDGFAMSFNTGMLWVPGVPAEFDFHGHSYWGWQYDTSPDTQNQDGAGFLDQDYSYSGDLTMYSGTLYTSVYRPTSGCANVQAFAKYSHTWSSTGLTGVGVGPWAISFSWADSNYLWNVSGPGSAIKYLC
jgi:hypothetical protein